MYKVKPEDVIPTRTDKQIALIEKRKGGFCGPIKSERGKGNKLYKKFTALAANVTQENAFELIEIAHKLSDIVNGMTAKNSVCAKGCSYCCQVNVDISDLEAAYIEEKTGKKATKSVYDKHPSSKDIPYCPFHDAENSICSIYEFRPLACRGFFAFDNPDLCIGNDQIHAVMSAWHNPSTRQLIETVQAVCGDVVGDIRSYFK